jgi:Tfp pilus assembly ATPase PilU
MVKSPSVEGAILKNELEKIPDFMAQSNDYYKMQTMNMALENLIDSGIITIEDAIKCSNNPSDLKLRINGLSRDKGFVIEEETDERTRTTTVLPELERVSKRRS